MHRNMLVYIHIHTQEEKEESKFMPIKLVSSIKWYLVGSYVYVQVYIKPEGIVSTGKYPGK